MKTFWEYQEEQEGKDAKASTKKSEEVIEKELQEITKMNLQNIFSNDLA